MAQAIPGSNPNGKTVRYSPFASVNQGDIVTFTHRVPGWHVVMNNAILPKTPLPAGYSDDNFRWIAG